MNKAKALPLRQPNDTAEMREAIEALEKKGVKIRRPSTYQLKIGEFNFWPSTARITKDGLPKMKKRGLETLLEMLPKRPARTIRLD